jgi:hypothetical protein
MNRLQNLEKLYGDNPGPAQINAMYDFIKSIDPDSVVREGEVRLTQEGQGYMTSLQNIIDKAHQDQVLPVDFYTQIVNVAQSINEDLQRGYAKRLGETWAGAENHGVPQELVFGNDSMRELAELGAKQDWAIKEAKYLPKGWDPGAPPTGDDAGMTDEDYAAEVERLMK